MIIINVVIEYNVNNLNMQFLGITTNKLQLKKLCICYTKIVLFAIIGELTDHWYKVRQERLLKEAALANEATEATSSKTKQFPKSPQMLKTASLQQKLREAISKLLHEVILLLKVNKKHPRLGQLKQNIPLVKGLNQLQKECAVITALRLLSYRKTRLLYHKGLTSRNYQIMV